jgi:hypothetical protein
LEAVVDDVGANVVDVDVVLSVTRGTPLLTTVGGMKVLVICQDAERPRPPTLEPPPPVLLPRIIVHDPADISSGHVANIIDVPFLDLEGMAEHIGGLQFDISTTAQTVDLLGLGQVTVHGRDAGLESLASLANRPDIT